MMKVLLAALALLLSAGMAKGDSIWEYSGNTTSDPAVGHIDFDQQAFIPTPNPCQCALSGSLTLSDANIPVLWNFTAGAINLTNLNSSISLNDMGLEWLGNPSLFAGWLMQIQGQGAFIYSSFDGSNFEAIDAVSLNGQTYQDVEGHPGVWSDPPAATPEPGTLALIGVGLVGLLARKRLQTRRNQIPEAVWEPLS